MHLSLHPNYSWVPSNKGEVPEYSLKKFFFPQRSGSSCPSTWQLQASVNFWIACAHLSKILQAQMFLLLVLHFLPEECLQKYYLWTSRPGRPCRPSSAMLSAACQSLHTFHAALSKQFVAAPLRNCRRIKFLTTFKQMLNNLVTIFHVDTRCRPI